MLPRCRPLSPAVVRESLWRDQATVAVAVVVVIAAVLYHVVADEHWGHPLEATIDGNPLKADRRCGAESNCRGAVLRRVVVGIGCPSLLIRLQSAGGWARLSLLCRR